MFPSIALSTWDIRKRPLMCSCHAYVCACVAGLSGLEKKVFAFLPPIPIVSMHPLEDWIILWSGFEILVADAAPLSRCVPRHSFTGLHRASLVFKSMKGHGFIYIFPLPFRFSMDTSKFIPSERKNCFPSKTYPQQTICQSVSISARFVSIDSKYFKKIL